MKFKDISDSEEVKGYIEEFRKSCKKIINPITTKIFYTIYNDKRRNSLLSATTMLSSMISIRL